MSSTIRTAKSTGSAVWTLLLISFAYGIFHAAGARPRQAVILVLPRRQPGNRGSRHRAVVCFRPVASAGRGVLVAICAWLLNATAQTMCGAEKAIEIASYALIAAFGARLSGPRAAGLCKPCRRRAPSPRWPWRVIITITIITVTTIHHDPRRSPAMSMASIAGIPTGPRRTNSPAPGRLAARTGRDPGRGPAAMLGRDPGAGVCAGAGPVLGGHRRDFRHGARHRHHGRNHCRDRGIGQGPGTALERPGSEGFGTLIMRGVEFGAAGAGAAVRAGPAVRLSQRRAG